MADVPVKSFSNTTHSPDSVKHGQVTPGERDERVAARIASARRQEEVALVVSPTSATSKTRKPAPVAPTSYTPTTPALVAPAPNVPKAPKVPSEFEMSDTADPAVASTPNGIPAIPATPPLTLRQISAPTPTPVPSSQPNPAGKNGSYATQVATATSAFASGATTPSPSSSPASGERYGNVSAQRRHNSDGSAYRQAARKPTATGGTSAKPKRQAARAAPAPHTPSLESIDIVASIPKRTGIAVKDGPSVVVPIEMPGDELAHGDVSPTRVLGLPRSVPRRKPAKPWLPIAVGISAAIVVFVGLTLVIQSSKQRAVGSSTLVDMDKAASVESLPTVTEHVVIPTPGQTPDPGDAVDPTALAVAPSEAKKTADPKQRQVQDKTDNTNSVANKASDTRAATSANQDNPTNVDATARTDSTMTATTPAPPRPSSGPPASHKPPTRSTAPTGTKSPSKSGVIVRDNPF